MLRKSVSKDRRQPLPDALRQRLRDIPRRDVTCDDVDRLYRQTLSEARPGLGRPDPAARRHLASCGRCQEVYGTLASAMAIERLPLPERLARRLGAITRHPERLIPVWISDTRYAAAACYLLATLALTMAGDAAALFRDTTENVNTKVEAWAQKGEDQSAAAWSTVNSKLGKGVDAGWGKVLGYGATCEKLFFDAVQAIEVKTNELIPDRDRSVEGEKDDRPRSDGT